MLNAMIMIAHVCIMLFMATYAFLFKRNRFDYLFLVVNYLILLHWTFLNGECVVTYVFKKLEDPQYTVGSNLHKDELKTTFKGNEKTIQLFIVLHNLVFMLNLYLVFKRNHISPVIYIPFLLLFEIYFYGLYLFDNHCDNPRYFMFQDVIKYLLIGGGVVCAWLWVSKTP